MQRERGPQKTSPAKIVMNIIALAAIVAIGVFAYRTWQETYGFSAENPLITGPVTERDVEALRGAVAKLTSDPVLKIIASSPTRVEVHTGVMKGLLDGGEGNIYDLKKENDQWKRANEGVTRKWKLE